MILLLRDIPAAEEAVHGEPGVGRGVGGAAVPSVGVDDGDGSGAAKDEEFFWMRGFGVGEHTLRDLVRSMGTGYDAGSAVEGRERVEHPDNVADGIAVPIGEEAHVDVEGLGVGRERIGGPGVEAGELEAGSEDGFDKREEIRAGDGFAEDFAFIDEIGEAAGVGLLPEFGTGVFAFFLKELSDALAQAGEQVRGTESGDEEEALLIELAALIVGHRASLRRAPIWWSRIE